MEREMESRIYEDIILNFVTDTLSIIDLVEAKSLKTIRLRQLQEKILDMPFGETKVEIMESIAKRLVNIGVCPICHFDLRMSSEGYSCSVCGYTKINVILKKKS